MKLLISILLLAQSASVFAEPPRREVSVIVTKEGYYPKNITVFQGETVKFFVTSTVEEPDCVLVQGHKVFLAATKGKMSEGEAKFDTAGTFSFYCPSSKHDGKITVMKKAESRAVRGLAGQNDPEVWIPKDYE